jgi:hypothetical protein
MHYSAFAPPPQRTGPPGKIDALRLLRFTALAIPIYAAAQPVIAFVPATTAFRWPGWGWST